MTKVPFPYSPINSSSLHWMVAKDARIFEKYGLDVDMVFMGASSLILQSMLSGAPNLAGFAGPAIISNVLRGGDVISVSATTPLTISLMTRPEIWRVLMSDLELVDRSSVSSTAVEAFYDTSYDRCNVKAGEVDAVFTTGGSSFVPAIRRIFEEKFGAAKPIEAGQEFTSVAMGLAIKAAEIFGRK